jgi:hypothetical protein
MGSEEIGSKVVNADFFVGVFTSALNVVSSTLMGKSFPQSILGNSILYFFPSIFMEKDFSKSSLSAGNSMLSDLSSTLTVKELSPVFVSSIFRGLLSMKIS